MSRRTQIPNVIGGAIILYLIVWLLAVVYVHTVVIKTDSLHVSKPSNQADKKQPITTTAAITTTTIKQQSFPKSDNPWYGWQPKISTSMECSWRDCFKEKHDCPTCRDSPIDLAIDDDSVMDPGKDWIPDVTMLRRMFLDGHDANGNPWPPPLDDELCEPMGLGSSKNDGNKALLDAVPVVGQPFSREISGSSSSKHDRVLCLIYTMESSHATNIRAIRETWAPGCDGFLAFSTHSDPRLPAISLPHEGIEEYNNMWQKVRSIWSFVGKHYKSDFDWFYIGGEDLFVIPQNLKNYLGNFDPSERHFLGRRFKGGGDGTYFNSGGSGYALSRASLQCLMENFDHPACSPNRHTPMEDVMIAKCLKEACKISVTDTRDEQMRERFHPFAPASHYTWQHPVPPQKDWYEEYNKEWGLLLGKDCCAPDSIAFHYIKKPAMVRHLFQYLHWCKREL
jgi:glycoprotein-N-acetylgalactosamine 3-beta-galactosyltransferase